MSMDTLVLYQKITDIKPPYHQLTPAHNRPSAKRVQFNLKELDLHYLEEFKSYVTADTLKKFGGRENRGKQKIIVIEARW